MGSNRGWWNLSESTDSERAVKYNWDVSKVIGGIKVLTNKNKPNSALPRYSNTPNTVYFHQTAKGKSYIFFVVIILWLSSVLPPLKFSMQSREASGRSFL